MSSEELAKAMKNLSENDVSELEEAIAKRSVALLFNRLKNKSLKHS